MATNPAGVSDQWQTQCSNISQAFAHLFLNPLGADIYFVPLMNAAKRPRRFPAHKVVLLARSPVLCAQFHYDEKAAEKLLNENGENKPAAEDEGCPQCKRPRLEFPSVKIPEVELPDIEPAAFEQFLRFCYTDTAKITEDNAASILYIANRYNVPNLIAQTIQFICENTTMENVFEMIQFTKQFNYEGIDKVEETALEIIHKNTKEVLKSEAFLAISAETLEFLLSKNCFDIKEIELFKELINWAENRQKIPGNEGKSLRELLGSALFHIHFWLMSMKDFARVVVPTNILTDPETLYVFKKCCAEDRDSFFNDRCCPFPRPETLERFQADDRTIIFIVENAHELSSLKPRTLFKEKHFVHGCGFRVSSFVIQGGLDLNADFDGEGSDYWSCTVSVELMVVSKTPGKPDFARRFSHLYCRDEDRTGWRRFSLFIRFIELFLPENGWIDEKDQVTLKARLKVAVAEERDEENEDKGKNKEKP